MKKDEFKRALSESFGGTAGRFRNGCGNALPVPAPDDLAFGAASSPPIRSRQIQPLDRFQDGSNETMRIGLRRIG